MQISFKATAGQFSLPKIPISWTAPSKFQPSELTFITEDGGFRSELFTNCLKAWCFILLTGVILTGCSQQDPIDRTVREDSNDPFFPSGITTPILLSESAPVADFTAKALGEAVAHVTILETRQVHISCHKNDFGGPEWLGNYTALRVKIGAEQNVVLLQFRPGKHFPPGYWWYRVYP